MSRDVELSPDDFETLIAAINDYVGTVGLMVDSLREDPGRVSANPQVLALMQAVRAHIERSLEMERRISAGEPELRRARAGFTDPDLDALRVVDLILGPPDTSPPES